MDASILATYCLCDALLRALHHYEERQRQMCDAEVMTVALVVAWYFRGNFASAQSMLHMRSRSRFIRRLHQITALFLLLFEMLGALWKDRNVPSIYSLDSFPIAVYDTIRIPRARLYKTEDS